MKRSIVILPQYPACLPADRPNLDRKLTGVYVYCTNHKFQQDVIVCVLHVLYPLIFIFCLAYTVPFSTLVYSHMRLEVFCLYEHFNYSMVFPLLHDHEKSAELILEPVLHNKFS